MILHVHADLVVVNGATKERKGTDLKIGKYQAALVPSPYGGTTTWLVVKGTLVGQRDEFFYQLAKSGVVSIHTGNAASAS